MLLQTTGKFFLKKRKEKKREKRKNLPKIWASKESVVASKMLGSIICDTMAGRRVGGHRPATRH